MNQKAFLLNTDLIKRVLYQNVTVLDGPFPQGRVQHSPASEDNFAQGRLETNPI